MAAVTYGWQSVGGGFVNATTSGSWIRYARLLANAGASAIELNVYDVAADATQSGVQLEEAHIGLVTDVCAAIDHLGHLAGDWGLDLARVVAPRDAHQRQPHRRHRQTARPHRRHPQHRPLSLLRRPCGQSVQGHALTNRK